MLSLKHTHTHTTRTRYRTYRRFLTNSAGGHCKLGNAAATVFAWMKLKAALMLLVCARETLGVCPEAAVVCPEVT